MPAPLATYSDIEIRLGVTFTEDQIDRVNVLLADASAKIRSYTRQQFTLVEDDSIVLRPSGSLVRLPQTPVVQVSSVVALAGYPGIPDFVMTAWIFDGIDQIQLFAGLDQVVNYPEWWYQYEGSNTFRVTYDHGYPEVPDDVVSVCCDMAMRVLTSPSQVAGMVSERIGQYFYQIQQNTGAAGASTRLNSDDKEALDVYRRKATTIQVSQL